MRFVCNHSRVVALIEKIPGINTIQLADFGEFFIVMTPKVGTRSIRDGLIAFYEIKGSQTQQRSTANRYIYTMTKSSFRALRKSSSKPIFLITRDPYDRIFSCWKQKVRRSESFYPYFIAYYPLIRSGMPFSAFLSALSKISVRFSEKHFMPQSFFWGDMENIEMVPLHDLRGLFLRELSIEIGHSNPTKNLAPEFDEDKLIFEKLLAHRFAEDRRVSELTARDNSSQQVGGGKWQKSPVHK